ncbi:MAG: glycosyltransferase, partial [Acholeplasma sp.]|nr:glycosyltransferase [Acholeplasma sp.]
PTKLGEYLSTGIPTLLTNVGENSKYVKDNTHVFLVEPNNPKAYADKLDWILENYSQAKKIAMNGKMYIKENHSLAVEGKKLYNFLGNI